MESQILKTNRSFCPICLDVVKSEIIEKHRQVYLEIDCPKHGKFENMHKWSNFEYYKVIHEFESQNLNRYPTGLLIDINFDCNMKCNFCFAQANERREIKPTLSEIIAKVEDFKGISVYLCGGEPTLREDLPVIIKELKTRGFTVILLSNGKKLAELEYVRKLKKAGLDVVQLQFDTLDDNQYEFIRKEKLVNIKLRAIENLKRENIIVFLITAIIKDVNDNQVIPIINFIAKNSSIIKMVYFIPMWLEGRAIAHNSITCNEILRLIGDEYNIHDYEFIEYIKFNYFSSVIFQKLTKMSFLRYVPCSIVCYFLSIDNSIRPLSKLINTERVNYYLKIIYDSLNKEKISERIKLFFKINYPFFIKEFFLNKKVRQFLIATSHSFLHFFLHRSLPITRNNYSFQVVVEKFFDRFDAEFDMMEQCNLYTDSKDGFIPFCQAEIIRKKYFQNNMSQYKDADSIC